MTRGLPLLLLINILVITTDSLACKCPTRSIDKEADKAYDIVIGKVVSATPEKLSCSEYGPDVLFEFEVEFSYKGQLKGKTKIFGGQGGGSCGGILDENHNYLVVVYECDNGFFTTMCSDNAFVENASRQIKFLNGHFDKEYRISNFAFLTGIALIILILLSTGGLMTFNYYKKE
jgi:hypothetical protein